MPPARRRRSAPDGATKDKPAPRGRGPGSASGGNDEFDFNLENVESNLRIPAGAYPIVCADVAKDTSQAGNDMYTWTFRVTEGQYDGRSFKMWTALTPAALWKLGEVLEALELAEVGESGSFKRSDAIGRECWGHVEDDEYNGRLSSKLSSVSRFDYEDEEDEE